MTVRARKMKYELALNSIAASYCPCSIRGGYRTHWATAFQTRGIPASDGVSARLAGVVNPQGDPYDLVQDTHCRRRFRRHRDDRLLADSHGIQVGHGTCLYRRKDVGDGHGSRREEPRRDDEACHQGAEQHHVLHAQWRAVFGLGYARSDRQFLSALIEGIFQNAGRPMWAARSENAITTGLMPEHEMTQLSPANAERLQQAFLHCRDMEGT